MWLTAFINIIIYVFLALCARVLFPLELGLLLMRTSFQSSIVKGFIVVQNGKMRIPPMSERVHAHFEDSGGGRQSGAVALQML